VLGGFPQHAKMPERVGGIVIGDGNTFREHCTVHRAMHEDAVTQIGDHNLLMAGAHVAHDCVIGSHTIFANNVLLAGHVTVQDRAFVSGAVGVHQFCRIGSLAMVGGHARVVRDVPPFVTVDGSSGYIVGLNLIGLRRAGFPSDQVAELKAAYRTVYRGGLAWNDLLECLRTRFTSGPAAEFHPFFSTGKRGFSQERRMPPGATLKIRRADEEEASERAQRARAG
jgi:UDP-N-acetylglucosamine acyltransferase